MSNLEDLRALYREKEAAGLVDVRFVFTDAARGADPEAVAGEILKIEQAIRDGAVETLDFGDGTFTRDQQADLAARIASDRGAALPALPARPDGTLSAEEFERLQTYKVYPGTNQAATDAERLAAVDASLARIAAGDFEFVTTYDE